MSRPKILMTGHWEPLAIYKKPFVGMTWNYYEAVSYTHLDVYKRQAVLSIRSR